MVKDIGDTECKEIVKYLNFVRKKQIFWNV